MTSGQGVTTADVVVAAVQGIFGVVLVVFVIAAVGQIYVARSLRGLGHDLSETRFGFAAVMYLAALPAAFIGLVAFLIDVSSPAFLAVAQSAVNGQTTFTTDSILFTGSYVFVAVGAIAAGAAVDIAGAAFSYFGARRFLSGSGKLVHA